MALSSHLWNFFFSRINLIKSTAPPIKRCAVPLKTKSSFPQKSCGGITIKIKYFITISNYLPVSQLSNDIFNSDVFLFTLVFEDEDSRIKAKWNSRRKMNNGYITREVGRGKLPETYQNR